MATFEIRGLKEVNRALKALPDRVAKKVIRQSIRASLKPVLAAARSDAPKRSGSLKKAIKLRAAKARTRGTIRLVVRATGVPYVGPVEYGTGDQAANPFMRRAFDSRKAAALAECRRLIAQGLEREVRALRTGKPSSGSKAAGAAGAKAGGGGAKAGRDERGRFIKAS